MSTYARERHYRAWWLREHLDLALLEAYQELAERFPQGLADLDPLPEEISGEVAKGADK